MNDSKKKMWRKVIIIGENIKIPKIAFVRDNESPSKIDYTERAGHTKVLVFDKKKVHTAEVNPNTLKLHKDCIDVAQMADTFEKIGKPRTAAKVRELLKKYHERLFQ